YESRCPHVTQLDNLPNDLIIEIFDYLQPCRVVYAFFDLNERYDRLLTEYKREIDLTELTFDLFNFYCETFIPAVSGNLRCLKIEHTNRTEQTYLFAEKIFRTEHPIFSNLKSLYLYNITASELELCSNVLFKYLEHLTIKMETNTCFSFDLIFSTLNRYAENFSTFNPHYPKQHLNSIEE
ncbi:unnamed protein product, partial [Didymodactylos carnosus]